MFKRLALAAALIGLVPIGGHATDLRVPRKAALPLAASPGCNWCGLYFGVNFGYAGGDFDATFDDSRDFQSLSSKHSANGIIGGAHLGYNYQFNLLVIGAETDFMLTGLHKTDADGTINELPWLGTTRLRAGILLTPDLLAYGTGGVAYGHVKTGVSGTGLVATTPAVGWTLGGGAEYAFTPNVKLGAEYLHIDLDGPSVSNGFQTLGTRVPVDIWRSRLSYSF